MYLYRYTTSASTKGIALLMLALVVCMAAGAPNATTNGGDASRVGIEKGREYELY